VTRRKPVEWMRLDNAAKIFPSNTNEKDTKVFRFVCELKEEIDRDTLQRALDKTLPMQRITSQRTVLLGISTAAVWSISMVMMAIIFK
jgi:hypothetical protein